MIPSMSPEALALLGFLHRTEHGGPPPARGFEKAYNELLALNLAKNDTDRIKITDKGDALLRERYFSDQRAGSVTGENKIWALGSRCSMRCSNGGLC